MKSRSPTQIEGLERMGSEPTLTNRSGRRREGRKGSSASVMSKFAEDEDDTSEIIQFKRNFKPNPRLVGTIMIWLKNVNRLRAVLTSKGFYKWKYSTMSPQAAVPGTPEREVVSEQKNAYLLLFAENEKLREQLSEMRKTHMTSEKTLRSSATRLLLVTFFRKRISMKMRAAYDIWQANTRMMRLVAETSHRTMELAVGLQQVESERHYVRQTQTVNIQLRMLLSMAIYFFKWKGKIAAGVLAAERRTHEEQHQIIFQQLHAMRDMVALSNKHERNLMVSALKKGQDAMQQIGLVEERLAELLAAKKEAARRATLEERKTSEKGGRRKLQSIANGPGVGSL